MNRYGQTMAEAIKGINEKLKPSDGAGAYVKDFRKSDAPQFKGKSDKEIQKMAIAAYLDDKEENMNIGMNEKMMKGFVVRYTDKSGERLAIPYKTKDRAKEEVKALKKVGAKDIEITTHNLNFKEDVQEATMVSDISGISIPALKREAQKKNIKVSRVTPGGPMGAEYEVTFTGSERDLMRYAKEHLGFEGRNFKDLQKHLNMGEGFASDAQRRAAFAQGYKAKGKKGKKEDLDMKDKDTVKTVIKGLEKAVKTHQGQVASLKKDIKDDHVPGHKGKSKFEQYTGVPNPRTEGRKSNYATDDEDEEGANRNIIMQLYKAISLRGRFDVVFDDGKKQKVKEPIAQKAIAMHRTFKTSKDRLAFQNKISKSYRDLLNAIR